MVPCGARSILKMRKIANPFIPLSECVIEPYGLMHSHKVDPAQLNGEPGQSMQEYLGGDESEQVNEIRALPFFLGPSLAITDWLPENLAAWEKGMLVRGNVGFFRHCTRREITVWLKRWQNYAWPKSKIMIYKARG